MRFNDLTDEQRAKAGACNTAEELLTFVRDEGIELSEKDLDRISGGTAFRFICNRRNPEPGSAAFLRCHLLTERLPDDGS